MFPIEQSSFLHALGYAIGHSLWQMPLLWFAYYLLTHTGKWSSKGRYAAAVAASLSGLGWFLLTLSYYSSKLSLRDGFDDTATVLQAIEQVEDQGWHFYYNSAMATLRSLAPYLSCAYLVVMLVLSARLANGFRQVKLLRTIGISKPSVDWKLFVRDHAELLGIKRPVRVFISEIASSPLTIGFWKPIILVPLASINHLSAQQMEAVLLHELAHIRRHDYLVNIILQLSEIVLFFNPFMRLLLKQARLERENSCDDWVLQFQYNAADYARALLAIEQHSSKSLLAMGSNNSNDFELLNRVKRMVAPQRQAFNYRQQLSLLFLITILGLGFTVITPGKATSKKTVAAATPAPMDSVVIINKMPALQKPKQESIIPKVIQPAVDLVKTLESVNKVVNSDEFKAHTEQIKDDAEQWAKDYSASIEAKAASFEKDIEKKSVKYLAQLQNLSSIETSQKVKEILEKQDWEKVLAPIISNPTKALAMIPGLVIKTDKEVSSPESPRPPAPPAAPVRVVVTPARPAIIEEEINATINDAIAKSERLIKIRNMKRILADSIQQARMANLQLSRAKAEMKKAKEVLATHANTEDAFEYNYYNGSKDVFWATSDAAKVGKITKTDAVKEKQVASNICTATSKQTIKTESTTVLNGREISRKIRKEWENAQQQFAFNMDEEIQVQIHELQAEVQKGLQQLEKINIKTNVSNRRNGNNRVLVIEVEADN